VLIVRLLKLAIPFCAVAVSVPPRPVPAVSASVITFVALATRFPSASSISTWTAGEIVAPVNAEKLIAARLAVGDVTSHDGPTTVPGDGGHPYTRTVHHNAGGLAVARSLIVHGGRHTWYGGSPVGSYTDSQAPDSSAEMIRFFFEHSRT